MSRHGVCRLTGATGKLVRAHIIPEALSGSSESGKPFIQGGRGERPIRRWTSWYDQNLVTSDGEQFLAAYDAWGIKELRRLKLVWSSEGDEPVQDYQDWTGFGDSGHGVRILPYASGAKLRLFLLSILWRAAASRLPEFNQIRLPQRQLRRLGGMLMDGQALPNYFLPACLIQLDGIGARHNFTPMAGKKVIHEGSRGKVRIFRFYFDGLAVHFHRDLDVKSWRNMGDLCVQDGNRLGVITVPFANSLQNEIVDRETSSVETMWPEVLARLTK